MIFTEFWSITVEEKDVTAGDEAAFVTALGRCGLTEPDGEKVEMQFQLKIGLRKIDGQWKVAHEHHSIPATLPNGCIRHKSLFPIIR